MTLIGMIFLVVEVVVDVCLLTAPRYKIIQYAYIIIPPKKAQNAMKKKRKICKTL